MAHRLKPAAVRADPKGVSLPSAHRIVPPAVVAALVAVLLPAVSAGAQPQGAAAAAGVSAKSSAALRPSPVRIRKRAPKAPRALPATGRRP
jgi:hypothetical protein